MKKRYWFVTAIILCVVFVALGMFVAVHNTSSTVGDSHNPHAFLASLQHDPKAGEKIYGFYCATCHAQHPVISVGAPKIADAQDWHSYQSLDMATLLAMVNQGTGAMPPRGGCFECSDEQLRQAIQYLLPKIS